MKQPKENENKKEVHYKWIALSNTTIGILMSSINGNIFVIALPAIFRGMKVNPLSSGGADYMLWMLMGFTLVTATLLVTFGRLSDMYGRVRLYNLGFAIFTAASIVLYFTPASGTNGLLFIIIVRLFQATGSGFLMANSMAIITDAFASNERGFAMGLNQIASIGGTLLGLILGGILADIDWRLIFLVSVPVGLFGTVWAYLKLKEQSKPDKTQKIDWFGNLTFAGGLTLILLGITLGIMPYGTSKMGWGNPVVIAGIAIGIALLVVFVFIEMRVKMPMFKLSLFRIQAFTFGNISQFLSSVARGGLQFMLVIWLQGIWLPLHGYSFESTPLWSGIYMIPMTAGFFITGPLCGKLSDRFGQRFFTAGGMIVSVIGFLLLNTISFDFKYGAFFIILLILGIGMGMFAAPNNSSIMNSVPASQRGASSGMRATFQNTGMALSMALYFTILIMGLLGKLPATLAKGMIDVGVPSDLAVRVSEMPPTSALFAAFLGFNPMASLISPDIMATLP
ncbi:MAG: MFS transporter, partial [Treponema sp.]|nr:MFS transporter [Treponema sp.]